MLETTENMETIINWVENWKKVLPAEIIVLDI